MTDASNSRAEAEAGRSRVKGLEGKYAYLKKEIEDLTAQHETTQNELAHTQRRLSEAMREKDEMEAKKGVGPASSRPGHRTVAGTLAHPSPASQISILEETVRKTQDENKRMRHDLAGSNLRIEALTSKLVATEQELAEMKVVYKKQVNDAKEREDILASLRSDGFLRQDDADEGFSGPKGSPQTRGSSMYSDVTLRSLQLSIHSERQKRETLQKEVNRVTDLNQSLLRILQKGRCVS